MSLPTKEKLTEQDLLKDLATEEYPNKWRQAKESVDKISWHYWTSVREKFLAMGGLLKSQLHNNGLNRL